VFIAPDIIPLHPRIVKHDRFRSANQTKLLTIDDSGDKDNGMKKPIYPEEMTQVCHTDGSKIKGKDLNLILKGDGK